MKRQDIAELLMVVSVIGKAFWWTFVDLVKYFLPGEPCSVKDEVVLITGASRGLGKQLAIQFADLGAKVVLWSSKQANVDEVAKEIVASGGDAKAYECDVADEDQVDRVADKVLKDFGRVDILINNAGIMHVNHLIDTEPKCIRRMYNINVFAHYWTIKAFLPQMIKQGSGHVVAVSSAAGLVNAHSLAGYSASKHAVLSLMECVEQDAKDSNVHFTTVCPGAFLSGLTNHIHNRLKMFLPVMSAEEVARITVNAILTKQTHITVPAITSLSTKFVKFLFSRRAVSMLIEFMDFQFKNVES